MSEYYLMSQLPSLDGISDTTPIPITEERFAELCKRFLGKKALDEFNKLSLMPPKIPEESTSLLIKKWNEGERGLRLALAKARAEKLKKQFNSESSDLPLAVVQIVRMAVEIENPLEAEMFLNRYRLDFLETLRPMDTFSEDSVFYYGLKLKLILRLRQFDLAKGEAAYRNIYDSIISKEDIQ